MVIDEVGLVAATPSNCLLRDRETEHLAEFAREDDEAYCTANRDVGEFVVYFPSGGRVPFGAADTSGSFTIRWLNVDNAEWAEESSASDADDQIELNTPSDDGWVAVLHEE